MGQAKTTDGSCLKLRNYICEDTVGADQLELVVSAKARCSVKMR